MQSKKYWTHHERKYVYDVSNFFIKVFAELFSKSDSRPYYLEASSIATATATATVIPTMGLLAMSDYSLLSSFDEGFFLLLLLLSSLIFAKSKSTAPKIMDPKAIIAPFPLMD